MLGDPAENDTWNHSFANDANMLVVALNYRKAPRVQFPTPIHDLEAVLLEAFSDPALPIDPSRVAVVGFSAGGNLALAVSQLPSMKGRFRAAVPHYPATDMTVSREVKAQTRQYKPELGGFRARPVDYLLNLAPLFDWASVPRGLDMRDPLLSPIFADPAILPPYIFIIACELDMLVGEDWRMICKLAGRDAGELRVGRQEVAEEGQLILDDERFYFEQKTKGGSYKWLLVPDTVHGFDHDIPMLSGDAGLLEDAAPKREKIHRMIAEWLMAGPFSTSSAAGSDSKMGKERN